jgi:hypothetical protein
MAKSLKPWLRYGLISTGLYILLSILIFATLNDETFFWILFAINIPTIKLFTLLGVKLNTIGIATLGLIQFFAIGAILGLLAEILAKALKKTQHTPLS